MISAELRGEAARIERLLARGGIAVSGRRLLENGIRLTLSDGCVECGVNLYHSRRKGLSVVPAGGDASLQERALGLVRGEPAEQPRGGARIGGDEAGKGDYIGPLTVCAVYAGEDAAAGLRRLGVRDSKTLERRRLAELAGLMGERELESSLVVIEPEEYNRRFEELRSEGRNSLDMLAQAHGRAVGALLESGCEPEVVVVDRFCRRERIAPHMPEGAYRLELPVRGESDVVVAAASILARAAYDRWMEEASGRLGVRLPAGSGREADRVAGRLLAAGGMEALRGTVKLHFRNTGRLGSGLTKGLERR